MADPDVPGRSYVRADEGSDILVVEDHPVTLEFVRFALTQYGYRVRPVTSVAAALAALDQGLPDLVVLDLMLPDAHGLEICKHLRCLEVEDDVPILVVTEDERPQSHGEAVRAGVDDFLRKPILAPELQTRVRSLLRLKRLRRQLFLEKEALLDLQLRQEQMVQFAMHDMKNVLSALLARAELAEEEDSETDWREHRRSMVSSARSLQSMMGNFLDLSLADQVHSPLKAESLDARAWVPQVVGEFRNFGARRKHTFEVKVDGIDRFRADPHLLRRALFNLLDNAVRYAPEQTSIQVEASRSYAGHRMSLAVADQGPGVPDAIKPQVFERMFQAEAEHHGHYGRGLGLAFCRLVAQRHGGDIHVEDNHPRGSRFVMEFPLGLSEG
ncbi:MAG TPA: hybrid sensor histidine kinase/response regulator [Holophagaceae bacterium]